jgi:hypothetical protein
MGKDVDALLRPRRAITARSGTSGRTGRPSSACSAAFPARSFAYNDARRRGSVAGSSTVSGRASRSTSPRRTRVTMAPKRSRSRRSPIRWPTGSDADTNIRRMSSSDRSSGRSSVARSPSARTTPSASPTRPTTTSRSPDRRRKSLRGTTASSPRRTRESTTGHPCSRIMAATVLPATAGWVTRTVRFTSSSSPARSGVVRPPEAAGREDCEDHPQDAERVGHRLAYHRVRESARVVSLRLGRVLQDGGERGSVGRRPGEHARSDRPGLAAHAGTSDC